MMRAIRTILLLAGKDLRIEARSRQTLALVIVLGLLIVVVLGLGLAAGQKTSPTAATAILWVAYLFGGVLCFEKTMGVERQDAALAALLLAPVDRGLIYVAKLVTNLVLMLGLAAVVTPAAVVLFDFDLSANPAGFFTVTLMGMVGFAAIGTLFSAVVSSTRLQGGLLAMVVFPLCLPLVVSSTQIMIRLFGEARPLTAHDVGLLGAFDAVYLVSSWLTFEKILEP